MSVIVHKHNFESLSLTRLHHGNFKAIVMNQWYFTCHYCL